MYLPMRACLTVLAFLAASAAWGDELDAPPDKFPGGTPKSMMHGYLLNRADAAIERWRADYEQRKTPEEIAAYQQRLRAKFLESIGGLPAERTPLDPQITGVVQRPGYRVEKVLFQSRPKFYVSALLFLPTADQYKPPYPGVIITCGHAKEAKGYPDYQSMGALLALNGMAALVFDPIDQGERAQLLGEGGWPNLWGVPGHIMIGIGSILLGQNTARFEIWDGMRAIDYLQSRKEIDPERIGCTGNSGGGTQTSHLMALDDRIRAAAPSCYITSLSRLLHTIGPQDAEQHLFGQLTFGCDHADLIMMRAPSPVLICAATSDFFDISGSWDSFRYAKRLYTRLGLAERVDIMENDAGHNYNNLQRQSVAHWMSRWLLGQDRQIVEPPITLLSEQEYQCTPDGLVMSLPGARSVYDLNEEQDNEFAARRATAWAAENKSALLAEVRRLAGIRPLADLPKPQVESLGEISRQSYKIEKLTIVPEEGIVLPALLFTPEKPSSKTVVLYLHQNGKAADAAPSGPIEQLVLAGETVLAVDLRGSGQTQPDRSDAGYSEEYKDAYVAYMLGRSYVGMRAEDILMCAQYAAERTGGTVRLVAIGNVGIPALHAAALEPQLFQSVDISRSLVSWSNVIHNRLSRHLVTHLVHGALEHYDLPDLAAVLGKKVSITQPVNAVGAAVESTK